MSAVRFSFDAPCLELSLNFKKRGISINSVMEGFDAPCLELSLNCYNTIDKIMKQEGFDAPCLELSLNIIIKFLLSLILKLLLPHQIYSFFAPRFSI